MLIPPGFHTTEYLSVDTETTGLSPHHGDRPFAVSMTSWEGEDFYARFQVNPLTREVTYTQDMTGILDLISHRSRKGLKCCFHNASFDLGMLYAAAKQLGYPWNPLEPTLEGIVDTLILAHAANSARATYALKPLCETLLNIPVEDQDDLQASTVSARKEGKKLGYRLAKDVEADYHLADPALCETYAIQDTRRTMALLKALLPLFDNKEEGPFKGLDEVVKMEHKLQMAVLEMNIRGIRVSPPKIEELKAYYEEEIKKSTEKMVELGFPDFNPNSPKQKKEVFYNQLGYAPFKRRRKGKDGSKKQTVSVDKHALASIAKTSPLAYTLLELSEAKHQLNSFITPFRDKSVTKEDGTFLFPNFNSVGPATGRLSCSGINLQNITSSSSPSHKTNILLRARECFIPREGHAWMLADYSQVEIWVAAFLSKDKVMCDTLLSGKSVHDITCDKVFGHKADFLTNRASYRKLAKILTFSILYGSGPKALSELLGVTYEEAKVYYNNFWKTYAGLKLYADHLERQIKQNGYIKDMFGRVYFLSDKEAYKALNYMVQGTAAGILKRAHLGVFNLLKTKYPEFKIIASVHDELGISFPKEKMNKEIMEEILLTMSGDFHKLVGMPKPFVVEASFVLDNWGKKLKF